MDEPTTPISAGEARQHSPREKSGIITTFATPLAILLAGGLVAGAVLVSKQDTVPKNAGGSAAVADTGGGSINNVKPVGKEDHIFGNPKADVTLIEYSDFECPFCARFHPTLKRIVNESDKKINWAYRHFPLTSIHASADAAARASECIARKGGNDAFWAFADKVFENQGVIGQPLFEQIALKTADMNSATLASCMAEESIAQKVNGDLQNAIEAGGNGTPYVVVINTDGDVSSFSGALPYEQIMPIVNKALR